MFQFSLQPVLVVRKQSEDAAQRDLGKAMKELTRVEQQIQAVEDALANATDDRRRMRETDFLPAREELHAVYARDLRDQIAALRSQQKQAQAVVEQRRAKLIEASRKRQVLDELKKMELAKYVKKENTDERKRNDDVAVFLFNRRKGEKALA